MYNLGGIYSGGHGVRIDPIAKNPSSRKEGNTTDASKTEGGGMM